MHTASAVSALLNGLNYGMDTGSMGAFIGYTKKG